MKVKVQKSFNKDIDIEDVKPLFTCKHVEDTRLYPSLAEVEFAEGTEYILVENSDSPYGYSALWLKDRKNKIYEWDGFGHSGACSVVTALLKENIELTTKLKSAVSRIKELEETYKSDSVNPL